VAETGMAAVAMVVAEDWVAAWVADAELLQKM
jgi:hypothetical protein